MVIRMTCTFFGHRNTSDEIKPILRSILCSLIENHNVDLFYVGNQGCFDNMVRKALREMKSHYPHIKHAVVLAYMPVEKKDSDEDYSETVYPDGLENTPPQYAIVKRNRWMIDQSDYVVTYVTHLGGGAAKFKELAEKKKKVVINLAEHSYKTMG